MYETTPPEMTVVLVAPRSFETIAEAVACIARQTVADRLELLIVHDRNVQLHVPDLGDTFYSLRTIAVDHHHFSAAKAEAIWQARALVLLAHGRWVGAAGEFVGYLIGRGDALERIGAFEFHL